MIIIIIIIISYPISGSTEPYGFTRLRRGPQSNPRRYPWYSFLLQADTWLSDLVIYNVFVRGFLLGAFANLRKAKISFVMSVRLSVLMELRSHWADFDET
jgi:hypothetical protein